MTQSPSQPPTVVSIRTLSSAEVPDWRAGQPPSVQAWVDGNGFDGSAGTHLAIPDADGAIGAVVAGVGEQRQLYSIAQLAEQLPVGDYELIDDWSDPVTAQLALGFLRSA